MFSVTLVTDGESTLVNESADGGAIFESTYMLHFVLRAGGFDGAVVVHRPESSPIVLECSEAADEDALSSYLAGF